MIFGIFNFLFASPNFSNYQHIFDIKTSVEKYQSFTHRNEVVAIQSAQPLYRFDSDMATYFPNIYVVAALFSNISVATTSVFRLKQPQILIIRLKQLIDYSNYICHLLTFQQPSFLQFGPNHWFFLLVPLKQTLLSLIQLQ